MPECSRVGTLFECHTVELSKTISADNKFLCGEWFWQTSSIFFVLAILWDTGMIPPCRTLQSQTIFSLPYENTGSGRLFMSTFPPVAFSQKNNDQDAWEFSLSWQCLHIHLYPPVLCCWSCSFSQISIESILWILKLLKKWFFSFSFKDAGSH